MYTMEEAKRQRKFDVDRGVQRAMTICRQIDNMPESVGYLAAPSNGSGEFKNYWTPSALRRTVELDIVAQAKELNHQALQVYRDQGVSLCIFERYDSYLDNQELYTPHPRDILDRGNEFPNVLEAFGSAMLGYTNNLVSGRRAIEATDYDETIEILMQMGGRRYLNDDQYASKMARSFDMNFGLHRKEPDRFNYAIRKLLDLGLPSLCRDADAKLSAEESVEKILRKIKTLDANVSSNCSDDGSVVNKSQASMYRNIERHFQHNDLLNFTMDAEITQGVRDFDPVLVFNRFMIAIAHSDAAEIGRLAEKTQLTQILADLHSRVTITKADDKILQAEKSTFTPLLLLRAIDASMPKEEPAVNDKLFSAVSEAGLAPILSDTKHVLAFAKGYTQKGTLNLNKFAPFQDLLRTHLAGVSFESAMQLCQRHPKMANPAALDHAKAMLQADKKSAMALTSDSTIEKIFAGNFSEAYQSVLKLVPEDSMLSECPLSKSFEFRGKAFTQALGV